MRCDRAVEIAAVDHVGFARVKAVVAGAVGPLRTDDQVVETIAVEVAGRCHRGAYPVAVVVLAADHEAAEAGGDGGQVDAGRESCRLAEHHIGGARIAAAEVGFRGADDQVGIAVAIDVAGGSDRQAGLVAGVLAANHEAAAAGGDVCQADRAAATAGAAEHHVAVAGIGLGIGRRVAKVRADDQVVEAVAVQVADGGHRAADLVTGIAAADDKAAAAGGDIGKRQIDKAAGAAEHHIGGAAALHADGADDQVVEAVAVEIASRCQRGARAVAVDAAVDDEAAGAGGDRVEVDAGAEATALAEDHVAAPGRTVGIVPTVGIGIVVGPATGASGIRCADDDVVEAVAVDVAGAGHRGAQLVARDRTLQHEAAAAGLDVGEADVLLEAACSAEYHIAGAGAHGAL